MLTPFRTALLSASAAAALCGCASLSGLVDETTSAAALPASPAAQGDGTQDWVGYAPDALPSTDWVASFNDPILSRLVDEAIVENPNLLRAAAQFSAALNRARISRGALYPALDASFSAARNEGGTGFFAGSSNYDIGVNASWQADLFGRLRDARDADIRAAQASAADLAGLRVATASQLAQSWFDAIEANLLVALSDDDIATQERILRLTQARFESGLTGASDVRLARSALASSRALAQTRLQNRDAVLRGLQTLLRDYPDARLDLPADLPELPTLAGAGGPAFVLSHRPDIIAEEFRIAQAGLNVDVARKALYPSLSFSGTIADQAQTDRSTNEVPLAPGEDPGSRSTGIFGNFTDIFDLSSLAYRVATQLTAPIFRGGQLRAQVDAQRDQLAAQLESYVGTVLDAYLEVENALDAERRLAAREDALRVALEESDAAERRLRLRYTEGLATILQLLDAQNRSLNSEGQLIAARSERLANRVRLHAALGGGALGTLPGMPDITEERVLPIPFLGGGDPEQISQRQPSESASALSLASALPLASAKVE